MIPHALLAALALVASPLPAHGPALASAELRALDDVKRATEWPEIENREALDLAVRQVWKATSDEMEALGRGTIEATGAAAAPLLLKALEREKDDDAIARVGAALDAITGPEHTRLLAAAFDDTSAPLRRYALRRVATLGDGGLRERAEELVAAFTKRLDAKRRKERVEEDDVDLAAVLAMSTGSALGVERVLGLAGSKGWTDWRDALRGAASSARAAGDDVANALAGSLKPGTKTSERVAALRLIAYAGTEKQARAVLPALDANANHVKVAAINALRMMVDGDPPLDKLSTFDAIERAQKWKTRL